MILPITKLPSPVLRKENEKVHFPLSKDVRKLLKDMLTTVKVADGIGLAAPQVSKNLQLALIYLEEAGVPAFPIFNPRIIKASKEQVEIEEGCLSIPGVFGLVKRPKEITLEAENSEGQTITLTDDGWIARVIQHELDHLHGTLIIDRWRKVTRGQELLSQFEEHHG
jgi:peptide deformylase